ncbi:hypothetical protein G3I42_34605 [Streptomyces sp. SID11385]|nr:hypothetical protein [Streptomyces sp. SID11385]
MALGLVLAAGTAAPVVAAPEPAPRAGSAWHTWRAAGPERNEELRGVTALSPRDAWAVGYRENEKGVDVPVAEHFDGTAWRATKAPGHAGAGQLEDVLARGRDDVWAVGSWNDAPAYQDRALAQHWDGERWRGVPLPAGPARLSVYPAALAPGTGDEVWTVGVTAEDRVGAPHAFSYRWDGRRWAPVPQPDPESHALLSGLAADRTGGLWAVGVVYGENGAGRPLTRYWNGAAWHTVPAPHTAGWGEELSDVTVLAPADVWAVGSGSPPEDDRSAPFALHWNGIEWKREDVPGVDGRLEAVAPDGAGGVWVIGARRNVTTPAFSLHRDARGTWSTHPSAGGEAGEGGSFFDLARVPGASGTAPSLWAVGSTLPRLETPWHPILQGYGPRGPAGRAGSPHPAA